MDGSKIHKKFLNHQYKRMIYMIWDNSHENKVSNYN